MEDSVSVIDKARNICLGAINHVEAANYSDRAVEARKWVNQAFDKVEAENAQLRTQLATATEKIADLTDDNTGWSLKLAEAKAKVERAAKMIQELLGPEYMEGVRRGLADQKAGRVVLWSEIRKELGLSKDDTAVEEALEAWK